MKKSRLIYLICSVIVMSLLLTFVLNYSTQYNFYLYAIIILIIIPNFAMKRSERENLLHIIGDYALTCDALIYYERMEEFYKSLFLSKKNRKLNNINLALIKIELGEIEEAKKLLLEAKDLIDKARSFNRYNYFRAWCAIYYETMEVNHYAILLEEMRKIVDENSDLGLKNQLITNFRIVEAKYFIMNGIYLDKARNVYSDILNGETPPIMKLSSCYYLGVISAKENKVSEAIEYFKKVAFTEKKIIIVTKAMKYIELLEK